MILGTQLFPLTPTITLHCTGYGSGSTDYDMDWSYTGEYSYLLGTEVDVY